MADLGGTRAGMSFDEFVVRATGREPYRYQAALAEEGLPELLVAPTGAGKTLAATLPWLYRRREHPDPQVRRDTPRWLVFTLPMRVLVEQTEATIGEWLDRLALSEKVGLYRLLGGEGHRDARWRYEPERDAVFVGTLDMLLSRALNRGYGDGRWVWPVDFGLLNAGTQWVFDEVQLMGPGLPTSRQLDGLRAALGVAAGCRSMWMSATVTPSQLVTVDNPQVRTVVRLPDDDRRGRLRRRLDADKKVRHLKLDGTRYERALADAVAKQHASGTRTLVMLNTVERATAVYAQLAKAAPGVERVLVHSRFRAQDRRAVVNRATARVDEDGPGLIVVSTQVLEAGVDVSAKTLVTETAPWASIVQRAGRCNREGEDAAASLWWVDAPKPAPYAPEEMDIAGGILRDLEGRSASPGALEAIEPPAKDPLHPVLRRRDLIELFDTLPDLSGNDIDVSRFIREADDLDVQVAWLPVDGDAPDASEPLPARDERCPVPVRDLRGPGGVRSRRAWRFDHIAERWVRCAPTDIRPGQVLLLDSSEGGYDPDLGWSPNSTAPVPPAATTTLEPSAAEEDVAVGDDPATFTRRRWVELGRHLGDVEREVGELVDALANSGTPLPPGLQDASVLAGRYHDLGKAHAVFQATLEASAAGDTEKRAAELAGRPWAKSGGSAHSKHERPHFRHELASALALLGSPSPLDGHPERDLIVYLVAAHHGRVRLGFRALPGELPPPESDRLFALGVWDGDPLPAVEIPGAAEGSTETVAARKLDLSPMRLGRSAGAEASWTERSLKLRDRDDLGIFRLAFLEALVRVADWRVSAGYDTEGPHRE